LHQPGPVSLSSSLNGFVFQRLLVLNELEISNFNSRLFGFHRISGQHDKEEKMMKKKKGIREKVIPAFKIGHGVCLFVHEVLKQVM